MFSPVLPPDACLAREAVIPVIAGKEVVPERNIQIKEDNDVVWKALWDEARRLVLAGRQAEAVPVYEKLLVMRQGLEVAQWELAKLLLQMKRGEDALPHLEVLAELDPHNLEYLGALAETLHAQGNVSRSVELYRRILLREPENQKAGSRIASGLLRLQKKKEALPILESLFQKNPERVALHKELAQLYFDLGMHEKALPLFLALVNDQNADLDCLANVARLYEKLGHDGSAAEYWQRLSAKAPGNSEARERLTAYYLKEGKGADALKYLTPLLRENPGSPQILKRLGLISHGMSRYSDSLEYLERYIAVRPNDKEVLRLLVDIHAALGNKTRSMLALDRFLSLESELDIEKLGKAAALFEASGGFLQAAKLYERILESTPDDPDILAKRAKALLSAGDEAKANAMWAHLDRRQKLLEVLEILYGQDPRNQTIVEKLARMYLDRGELARSLDMFAELEALGARSREVRVAEASVYERLNRTGKALAIYEEVLAEASPSPQIRLRCIQLAGSLGLLKKTEAHLEQLVKEDPELAGSPQSRLLIAAALVECSSFSAARDYYTFLFGEAESDPELKNASLLGLATLQEKVGLPFEAAQSLRQAYLLGLQRLLVLSRLFSLSVQENRVEEARLWLEQFEAEADRRTSAGFAEAERMDLQLSASMMRARLLAATGEHGKAIHLLRRFSGMEHGGQPDALLAIFSDQETDSLLARLLLVEGEYQEAERLALSMLEGGGDQWSAQALLLKICKLQGRTAEADSIFMRTAALAREDQRFFLRFLGALHEQELGGELLQLAEEGSRLYPDSLSIRSLLAKAERESGQSSRYAELLAEICREFPEDEASCVQLAQLHFRNGRFGEALYLEEALAGLERPDLFILRARILWAQGEWEESQQIYDAFLAPSVTERIEQDALRAGVSLPRPEGAGLWAMLTVPEFERPSVVDALMLPGHLLDSAAGKVNLFVVPYYAQYCWQKRFSLERAARQAVMRREYLAASTYFEKLLREYPSDPSLQFDLAGIYSRFGQLADEAALYAEIAEAGELFPGVEEAWARNELKRRPRLSFGYGNLREDGRDGYKAIRKNWEESRFRYSPYLQHELGIDLARLHYRDSENRLAQIDGSRAFASYDANLDEHLRVKGGVGAEVLEGGGADTLLFSMALESRLSDRLTGTLSYRRDVNHDTLASLRRNIVQQDYKGDLVVNLVPSLQVGGGVVHTDFSDSNAAYGYELRGAYLLFFEPAFLKFSYTYDYRDTDTGHGAGALLADGFALADHPYWAPVNYWENRFSLYFRHQISDDQFRRGVPRYYDLEYVLAYDARGYPSQTWKGGVFVECTEHIMLEAGAEMITGQEYRARELFLSAVYRW